MNPLSKAREQNTMQWLSWGLVWEIHIVQVIAEKATHSILFLHPFLPCFHLLWERKMSTVLAPPWALKGAFLGWCLPSKKYLYFSHMLAGTLAGRQPDGLCQSGTRVLPTAPAPLPPLWLLSFPSCSYLIPIPPSPTYSHGINVNFLLALLTQHSVKYSFPMHVFDPDWKSLDAKHISFLVFVFFSFCFVFVWYNQALFLFVSMHHHCNKCK